jgi:DNA repair photolyase
MFLPQNRQPKEDWGRWLDAKQNAVELAGQISPKMAGKAIYISSVTDPYLPAERSLVLTRGILETLLPYQPRVVMQTRSPLVLRDIDLLIQFRRLRVNISITTDSEEMWTAFEPKSPPLEKRWQTAEELKAAGIAVGLTLTPLLPLIDEDRFVDRVASFAPTVLVLQDFHVARGFGADTAPAAREMLAQSKWGDADYRRVLAKFRARVSDVYEGEKGFFPP